MDQRDEGKASEQADERRVDEASEGSFPASDPPSFTPGQAMSEPAQGGAHHDVMTVSRDEARRAIAAIRGEIASARNVALDTWDVQAVVQRVCASMHLDRAAFDAVVSRDGDLGRLYHAAIGEAVASAA